MGLLDDVLGTLSGIAPGGGQTQSAPSPLGGLLGSLGSGNPAQGHGLLAGAMAMIQQSGGLSSMLDKFRQNGMGQHADSWVGNGPNMGISADQVQQALGPSSIGQIATKLGMSNSQAGSALAQILPELVNHLTPNGQVPDNHQELLSKALAMLRGANG